MNRLTLATFASIAALGVTACGSDVEEEPVVAETETMGGEDTGPVTGGSLSEEQQARYDTMDRQAVSDEYDTNYETLSAGAGTGSEPMSASTATSSSTPSPTSTSTSSSGSSSTGTTMPPRSQMDFAFLDRNDDGRLSVAEYAIWAVGVNPTVPKQNDQTRPYLREDQINQAGQTFFYFDRSGDTYLSPDEFQAARSSARMP